MRAMSALPVSSRILLVPAPRTGRPAVRRFRLARLEINPRPERKPGTEHLKRIHD